MTWGFRVPSELGESPGRKSLSSRMALGVDRFQPTVLDLRVDLGCANAGVAQDLLQGSDFRSPGEHMCGKAMSERVGADLSLATDSGRVFFDEMPDVDACERPTRAADEQVFAFPEPCHFRPFPGEVLFDGLDRDGVQRDDPFLVPLTETPAIPFFESDVRKSQTADF